SPGKCCSYECKSDPPERRGDPPERRGDPTARRGGRRTTRRRTRIWRWPERRALLSIPGRARTARKPVQLTPWRTRQQQSAFSWYLSTKRIYDERVCSPAIEFELEKETVTFHRITNRCLRNFALHNQRAFTTPASRSAPPVSNAPRTCAS